MQRTNGLHLTSRQIKAARALLDWSQEELAAASDLSIATIRKLELGFISPRDNTMQALREAFENVGVEFIGAEGVRIHQQEVSILRGFEGMHAFFDDVYKSVRQKGGEVLHVCASEIPFTQPYGEECMVHLDRMTKIKNTFSAKCILTEDDKNMHYGSYSEYRFLLKDYLEAAAFYVYDDVYALFDFDIEPSPQIIVIKSRKLAQSYRRQFHSMWEKAVPLKPPAEVTFLKSIKGGVA